MKRWCGNVYNTSEHNYKTFNKIQAKSSFGRHVGGQEHALRVYIRLCKNGKRCLNVLCQFLASARFQLIVYRKHWSRDLLVQVAYWLTQLFQFPGNKSGYILISWFE